MIAFTVPGRPQPKERPRVGRNGAVYTPKATKAYEQLVAWCASSAMQGRKPITGPVGVEVVFYFRDQRTPDLDNCLKAVLDGMQGVVFANDRQVRKQRSAIEFDPNELTEVRVWALAEEGKEAS